MDEEQTIPKVKPRIFEWFVLLAGLSFSVFGLVASWRRYPAGFDFDMADEIVFSGALIVIVCLLFYLAGLLAIVMGIYTKHSSLRWLLVVLIVPAAALYASRYSGALFSTFRDGMADHVRRDVSEEDILRLAADIRRASLVGPDNLSYHEEDKIAPLLKPYPSIALLNPAIPRIEARPDYIEISWGGGMTGICGLRIVDSSEIKEPITVNEREGNCQLQNVYPRTWVYRQTF